MQVPQFCTIRQVAATGILSEYRIRLMVAAGKCPGIWAGTRFMVNLGALTEQLERESRSITEGSAQ